ncbi:uncharacterized protein LOC141628314 [Silene latifolia]|uniref:uncharacterized protein LOC141628314 n=1 Tax=Silene latifolia TaxID=37657 RepID=UPI003D77F4B0
MTTISMVSSSPISTFLKLPHRNPNWWLSVNMKRVSASVKGELTSTEGVKLTEGIGNLPKLVITSPYGSEAEIYLFGACLTSWKTATGKDLLFVRLDAVFNGKKTISGGIPHCFPQFGPGKIQQHGFASNVNWSIVESESVEGKPVVMFELKDSPYSGAMWDFSFQALYKVSLQKYNRMRSYQHFLVKHLYSIIEDEELELEVPEEEPQKVTSVQSVLRILKEDVADEIYFWSTSVYCYIVGANPPSNVISGFVKRVWPSNGVDKVSFLPNGIFLLRFKTKEQQAVLSNGHLIFDNKPVIIKEWKPGEELLKHDVSRIPLWVKLYGLDIKFWGVNCLKKISGHVSQYIKCDDALKIGISWGMLGLW